MRTLTLFIAVVSLGLASCHPSDKKNHNQNLIKKDCSDLSDVDCNNSSALIKRGCTWYGNACVDGTIRELFTSLPVLTAKPNLDTTGWTSKQAKNFDCDAEIKKFTGKNDRREHGDPQVIAEATANIGGTERSIKVVYGNIINEKVDVITNAAQSGLRGGGGVDGAIHAAAGGKLKREGEEWVGIFGPLAIGSAMSTYPYELEKKGIKVIVHTVSPGGAIDNTKDIQNYSSFYNSIKDGSRYPVKSIAIPSLGTGLFHFPLANATTNFFLAATAFFKDHPNTSLTDIRITNFDAPTVKAYCDEFKTIFKL